MDDPALGVKDQNAGTDRRVHRAQHPLGLGHRFGALLSFTREQLDGRVSARVAHRDGDSIRQADQ